jgi:hypothetical protein
MDPCTCRNCGGRMVPVDPEWLSLYQGAYSHRCEEHLCRGRAWSNSDGSTTWTGTLEEMVREINARSGIVTKQESAASGKADDGSHPVVTGNHSA